MGEKFTSHFAGQERFISSEKSEPERSPSQQPKTRDFLYDPQKQEILIFSETRGREIRHPFQEFLYALREAEIKVSTSEWIDLQKVLAEGEIQSIDDLYIVSRALLVKDVADYSRFDTVFGRMFYGLDSLMLETEEEQDDYEVELTEFEEEEEKEEEEEEEENQSPEIVEPGFTEEHHGGEDVHKVIEDSQSSGHEGEGGLTQKSEKSGEGSLKKQEGMGKKLEEGEGSNKAKEESEGGGKEQKTGEGDGGEKDQETGGGKGKEKQEQKIIIEGKGGYTARELVIERKYDQYDKDQVLNYEQFGRVLSKLTAIIQQATEMPTGKLDAQATVKSIAEHAGIPELVWREETEKKPKVILMFDVGGSTDNFRPIMEKLFAAAKDYLDDVEVYYFHNAIYGDVWPQKDGNYGQHFIPLKEILKKEPGSRIIIIGDAWMAENELYQDYTDEDGHYFPSGLDSFEQVRRTFDHAVWVNPISKSEHNAWDRSGTIATIKKIFNMYDITLRGLEDAVLELMED